MSSIPSFDAGRVARNHFQPVVGTAFEPSVLHFMMAGTVTVLPVDAVAGEELTYDVLQGQTLPLLCRKITAVGTITIDKIRGWR